MTHEFSKAGYMRWTNALSIQIFLIYQKKRKKKEGNSLIGLSNKKVKFAKMKFIARVNGIPQGH